MAPPGGRDWVRMTPRPFCGEQGSPQRTSELGDYLTADGEAGPEVDMVGPWSVVGLG